MEVVRDKGKNTATDSEVILKEHPNFTRWWEGARAKGVGNLILTNKRLVFLNQVILNEKQIEKWKKLAKEGTTTEQINFGLALHGKNFQIPLSAITLVKHSIRFNFLFPSLNMRIIYKITKRRKKELIFQFQRPFLSLLFHKELLPLTTKWVRAVKRAIVKAKASP